MGPGLEACANLELSLVLPPASPPARACAAQGSPALLGCPHLVCSTVGVRSGGGSLLGSGRCELP